MLQNSLCTLHTTVCRSTVLRGYTKQACIGEIVFLETLHLAGPKVFIRAARLELPKFLIYLRKFIF